MAHFRHVCEDHGTVIAQCRCPGPKDDQQRPCPGPPVCPHQGFRVTGCELDDEEAFRAMGVAAAAIVRAALDARLSLLALGFADDHSLCMEMDRTARHYATVQEAVRRQAARQPEA